jgi:soluble lytic murein transglycosylase-like protein
MASTFRCALSIALLQAASAAALGNPCWDEAAGTYGVSAALLHAIARAESDLNPTAINRSHFERTGSYDIGLMQINSRHLSRLAKAGIREIDLYDACTNVKVGAWILADLFARYGVTWEAVGAYNAACTQLKKETCVVARSRYAWRVYQRLSRSPSPSAWAPIDIAKVEP